MLHLKLKKLFGGDMGLQYLATAQKQFYPLKIFQPYERGDVGLFQIFRNFSTVDYNKPSGKKDALCILHYHYYCSESKNATLYISRPHHHLSINNLHFFLLLFICLFFYYY